MHLAQRVGRYFGYRRLTFGLDRISAGRLAWVSILPLAVIVALGTQHIASYRTDDFYSPDIQKWRQIALSAQLAIQAGVPLALAVLFAAGMQKWSRAAGSWMLMIALTFVLLSIGLGTTGIALAATTNFDNTFNFRAQFWTAWSSSFAFLAVGYLYVAYRAGLNRRPRRKFVRHRYSAFD